MGLMGLRVGNLGFVGSGVQGSGVIGVRVRVQGV